MAIDKPLCNDLGLSNTQGLLNNFMMIRVRNDLIRYTRNGIYLLIFVGCKSFKTDS